MTSGFYWDQINGKEAANYVSEYKFVLKSKKNKGIVVYAEDVNGDD